MGLHHKDLFDCEIENNRVYVRKFYTDISIERYVYLLLAVPNKPTKE